MPYIINPHISNYFKDLLSSPDNHSKLIFDEQSNSFKTEEGDYTYVTSNGIPVLFSNNSGKDSPMNYIEHYINDAEQFDYFEERTGGTFEDERRVREYISSFIPESKSSILDIGCGGSWAAGKFLAKGHKVCSLDVSLKNVEKALSHNPSADHFGVVADAYALPFMKDSFDVIIASEVIEHLTEPQKLISEALRCLKPGGKLIISTPYKEKLQYYLCIHCNQKSSVNAHLHSFDEHILKNFAKDQNSDYYFRTFGNKALLHLRTHTILKYLPFQVWKSVDSAASLIINKNKHIIARYIKK